MKCASFSPRRAASDYSGSQHSFRKHDLGGRRAEQILELGCTDARAEGILARKAMQERGHPAGEPHRPPDPVEGARRVRIERTTRTFLVEPQQCFVEIEHVARGEIQSLRSGRRHDVRRIASEKQLAVAHRLGDEAAQRRDALLDRRTRRHARGDVLADAQLEFVPEAIVAPLLDVIVERALHVAPHARRRAHAREREAALGIRVDQFIPCRRYVGQHAEPAERIGALETFNLSATESCAGSRRDSRRNRR